jgi:phosphomannomutase
MTTPADRLTAIFKAYDVRGTVPDQLDPQLAYAIGVGFATFAADSGFGPARILVGRDMRSSGPELASAFLAGAASTGASLIDIGLCSTDLCYYASGALDAASAMLTASHNPAAYNGMKFCLPGARPVGEGAGLEIVRDGAIAALADAPEHPEPPADVEHRDLLDEFADHVRSFVDVGVLRPLSIIADTANGMGGLIAPAVFAPLPFKLDILYGELDGTFPNHPADPIQIENLADLRARILERSADVGLAFDGDADRVFLVDELGEPLSGSTTTAIVAAAMLDRNPGATVLYNCICSHTVPEVIAEHGGVGVRTRVGHSFIKAVMAESGAIFGGEHSGHYYFAQNYRADSGIIAALVTLEVLSRADVSLSELRKPFERYVASGERNSRVAATGPVIEAVAAAVESDGATTDWLDGLTAQFGDWWFNLRPSNTEPLLRLNVEAPDAVSCAAHVSAVEALVRAADPTATAH